MNEQQERFKVPGNTFARDRHEREHGFFRVTHYLVYERERIAELCRFRGMYYTREGYESGEPGITRADLREGERIKRVRVRS